MEFTRIAIVPTSGGKSKYFVFCHVYFNVPSETGRYYGMEMNVEKTKVMRISRQPSPVTITIDQKQLENVKCFNICVAC
jgi:hypothetical protein